MTTAGLSEFVTGADVARRLNLTRERIRQMAESGALPPPAGRVGNYVVWRWRDVESFLQPRLEDGADGVRFRTIPHRPGHIEIDEGDGVKRGAVAWHGSKIIELKAVKNGVEVATNRSRGRISKNARGSWTLSSSNRD